MSILFKYKVNWKYAIGEVVLIFFGITLALAFNNWNEWRKDRADEKDVVTNLTNEFLLNKNELKIIRSRIVQCIEAGEQIMLLIGKDRHEILKHNFDSLLFQNLENRPYSPTQNVLSDLLQSGRLRTLSSSSLKELLFQWSRHLEVMNNSFSALSDWTWGQHLIYLKDHSLFRDIDYYGTGAFRSKESTFTVDKLKILEDYTFENPNEQYLSSLNHFLGTLEALGKDIDMIISECARIN